MWKMLREMNLINPLFALSIMGLIAAVDGIDVPEKIKRDSENRGFNCDCFNAPTGIVSTTGTIGGYTFQVVLNAETFQDRFR